MRRCALVVSTSKPSVAGQTASAPVARSKVWSISRHPAGGGSATSAKITSAPLAQASASRPPAPVPVSDTAFTPPYDLVRNKSDAGYREQQRLKD